MKMSTVTRITAAIVAGAFFLGLASIANAANFQRMFPGEVDDPSTDEAIIELTRLDDPDTPAANDGPMVDDNAEAKQNCDQPLLQPPLGCTPAGFTYLGQFLDHDVTLDVAPFPDQGQIVDPTTLNNVRTTEIDLDSVYNVGAEAFVGPKFKLGAGGRDLPRRPPSTDPQSGRTVEQAIIADPRNDENQVIAQIHLAFLRLHNAFVDSLPAQVPPATKFTVARNRTIEQWQRVVFNDLLPRFVGQAAVDNAVRRAPQFWTPGSPARMPAEFSNACWRVGHSNFRLAYRLAPVNNLTAANIQVFNGTFGANDLTGNVAIPPARFINWPNFFQFPGQAEPVNAGRKFDTFLSRGAFQLPVPAAIPGGTGSLPERNLVRARAYEIPSYEDVAERVGTNPVPNPLDPEGHGTEMPLWYGMLLESQLEGGRQVGPTCGKVIADVFVGVLKQQIGGNLNAKLPPLQVHELLTKAGVGP